MRLLLLLPFLYGISATPKQNGEWQAELTRSTTLKRSHHFWLVVAVVHSTLVTACAAECMHAPLLGSSTINWTQQCSQMQLKTSPLIYNAALCLDRTETLGKLAQDSAESLPWERSAWAEFGQACLPEIYSMAISAGTSPFMAGPPRASNCII